MMARCRLWARVWMCLCVCPGDLVFVGLNMFARWQWKPHWSVQAHCRTHRTDMNCHSLCTVHDLLSSEFYILHQNLHQNPAVELWSNGMHTSIYRLLKGLLNFIVFFVFLFHWPLVSLSRLLNNRLISVIWFNRDYFSQPWLLHSFRRKKGETYTKRQRHKVPPQLKSLLNARSLPGGRGWDRMVVGGLHRMCTQRVGSSGIGNLPALTSSSRLGGLTVTFSWWEKICKY